MKTIFLDRDGVINEDTGYVGNWSDFTFIDRAKIGMRLLILAGFQLVIITNQSGIARGIFTLRQYEDLTARMLLHLKREGIRILDVLHCPHHPDGYLPYAVMCNCRKPAPGLFLEAYKKYGILPEQSVMVGDKISDMDAAANAGIERRLLISSKYLEAELASNVGYTTFNSLYDAALWITQEMDVN